MSYVHNIAETAPEKAWKNALASMMQVLFKIDEKVATLQMLSKDKKKNQGKMNALILEMRSYFPHLDNPMLVLSLGGGSLNDLWLAFKNNLGGNVIDVDSQRVFVTFKALLVAVHQL